MNTGRLSKASVNVKKATACRLREITNTPKFKERLATVGAVGASALLAMSALEGTKQIKLSAEQTKQRQRIGEMEKEYLSHKYSPQKVDTQLQLKSARLRMDFLNALSPQQRKFIFEAAKNNPYFITNHIRAFQNVVANSTMRNRTKEIPSGNRPGIDEEVLMRGCLSLVAKSLSMPKKDYISFCERKLIHLKKEADWLKLQSEAGNAAIDYHLPPALQRIGESWRDRAEIAKNRNKALATFWSAAQLDAGRLYAKGWRGSLTNKMDNFVFSKFIHSSETLPQELIP